MSRVPFRWRSRLGIVETNSQQDDFTIAASPVLSTIEVKNIALNYCHFIQEMEGRVVVLLTSRLSTERRAVMSDTEAGSDDREEPGADPPRVLNADELFAGKREVWIELDGVRYRLRITRRGKLILQK